MIEWLISGGWILLVTAIGLVMPFQTPIHEYSPKRSSAKKAKSRKQNAGWFRFFEPAPPPKKTKAPKTAKAKTKKRTWATMHKVDAAEAQRVEEMFRRARG